MNSKYDNQKKLITILSKSGFIREVLDHAGELNLPNWRVGAGCIAQTVWNYRHGYDLMAGIKDCDLVYYDTNLSIKKEKLLEKRVKDFFAQVPMEFDVTNQARVHLWYEDYFGYSIKPYESMQEAISTWPTTATCIGITQSDDKAIDIYAPYGLDDLLNMIVRANKKQITKDIYLKKVGRWRTVWPNLDIVPW